MNEIDIIKFDLTADHPEWDIETIALFDKNLTIAKHLTNE